MMGDETKVGPSVPSASAPDPGPLLTETIASAPPELTPPSKRKINKKTILLISAVVILSASVVGFIAWRNVHKPAKPLALTNISVQLQWLHGAEFAGMYVAKDKGYYKDVGLQVDLKEYEDGADINKEVADEAVDFGVITPLEIMLGHNKGQKNKAIAAIYQISPYAIASRKDANIHSPADFRGKVLGSLGANNQAAVTYPALLAESGLTTADATIKGVDFDAVMVLKNHDADTADIYRTDQTFLLDQAGIEYNLIYPEDYGLTSYGDLIITSNKKIIENPGQVQAFVSATLKGWRYVVDNQEDTLAILTKYENDAYKTPGYEKFVLEATVPLVTPTGGQKLGSMDYTIWNRIYLTADATGLLTTPIEVTDLYTSQFIQ